MTPTPRPSFKRTILLGLCCLALGLLAACTTPRAHRPPKPTRLLTALEFSRFTVRTNLTKAVVATLMREKMKVGSDDEDAYNFLALPASPTANNPAQPPGLPATGQRIRVETVEQYVAALKRGASPFTTFDISMDTWFRPTTATLLFLSQADDSTHSSLPKELPFKLLYSLPVRTLNYRGAGNEADLTLRHYPHKDKLWIFNSDQISIQFEFDGKRYCLAEMARGDFNHDGFEDSLVVILWHDLEGSGSGVEFLLVEAVANRSLKAAPFPLK